MMSLLYEKVLKMLPKIDIALTTPKLKEAFQRRNTSYHAALLLQCKTKQHSAGDTVQYLPRTQLQILIDFPKWFIN